MSTLTVPGWKLPADLRTAAEHLQHGRIAVAARLAKEHLQKNPNDGAACYLLGTISLQAGEFSEARRCFLRAIVSTGVQSAQATCWNALGQALLGMHRWQRAQACFRHALRMQPATVGFTVDYARALIADGQLSRAAATLAKIAEQLPQDPKTWMLLGDLMMQCKRFNDALGCYDLALQSDSGNAAALVGTSTALLILGHTDKALAACSQALKLDPNLNAYYQLANLGGLEIDADHFAAAKQRAAAVDGVPPASQIDACFALAHVYDRKDNCDLAFNYLEKGNRLKRGILDFHIETEVQRIGGLTQFFNVEFIERFAARVESNLMPIFIVGMPRSGTTLLEQMLAAHPAIVAGGELDYLTDAAHSFGARWGMSAPPPAGVDEQMIADLRRTACTYAHAIRSELQYAGHFTDKMPANFLFVGLIHLIFPRAAIIQVLRNPMDTCLSCYQHLFPGHAPFAYDLRELASITGCTQH